MRFKEFMTLMEVGPGPSTIDALAKKNSPTVKGQVVADLQALKKTPPPAQMTNPSNWQSNIQNAINYTQSYGATNVKNAIDLAKGRDALSKP